MSIYHKIINIAICVLSITVGTSMAQQLNPNQGCTIYSSEKGNLISILPKANATISSEEFLKSTSYFKIKRAELLLNNSWTSHKTIGQTKRVKTVAELRTALSQDAVATIQKLKRMKNEQDVQAFLDNEYHIDSLMFFGFLSPKFLEAFGIGFNDTQAEKGVVYSYQVVRVPKSGREELWAEAKIVSKTPNPYIDLIKIRQDTIVSNDSLVFFKFHLELPPIVTTKPDTMPQYAPINTRLSAKEQKKMAKEQNQNFVNYFNTSPIDPSSLMFTPYYRENRKAWKALPKYQVSPDSLGVYRLGAFVNTTPETFVETRIVMEVYGGAASHPDSSELFGAYAISNMTIPLVYSVQGHDSADCHKISWSLPVKPYIRGVLIERRQVGNELEHLAIVPSSIQSYVDLYVVPGLTYVYYVKALFNPRQSVEQKMSATVSLTLTKFNPPLPPYNLRVDTASKKLPILKWDAMPSKSHHSFIVYRGVKPNELYALGDVVKGNTFTDSNGVFSAKVKMYYAVVSQNLAQDTSDFSNVVDFRPKMPMDIDPPKLLNYKLVNGDVFFDWPEMRTKDSYIGGYRLERRSELDTVFRTVGPALITTNFYTDTTYKRGYFHEYRLAAVSDDGQLSRYSMAFEVDFPMPRPSGVSAFSLRNTTKGVLVKWPSVALSTTKEYIIYRNDPPKAQLRKLATVPSGSFEYVDTAVSDTDSYLYAMSIVAKDGVESQRSPRKSLKRAKPNKLPTTPNAK